MSRAVRVAIDGPGGAGKTSVARAVSAALGVDCLDTGAMYRAVAAAALREGIDPANEPAVAALAHRAAATISVGAEVRIEGVDVSREIREATVTEAVSAVAANPEVRAELVAQQRAWAGAREGCVMEGRDITTVVLPDAEVRVYLTADVEVRARRRAGEVGGARQAVSAALARRDRLDATRAHDPLRKAAGVVEIDTTRRTVAEVVAEIMTLLPDAAH